MSRLQPVGQKRLTNICIVRLKRNGKRFEVAAYRNTVVAWRNKVERDIDEVLQVHTIFANVDKGILARSEDMVDAFGTDDEDVVCVEILNRGDFQVSEEERQMMVEGLFRDVASRVTDMCVNPETQMPYPLSTIERAMRETLHFTPATNKSAKMQALQVIRQLESAAVIPIERAKMHLRLQLPAEKLDGAVDALRALPESQGNAPRLQLAPIQVAADPAFSAIGCHAEPNLFRPISDLVRGFGGSVQVIELKANAANTEESPQVASAVATAGSMSTGMPEASCQSQCTGRFASEASEARSSALAPTPPPQLPAAVADCAMQSKSNGHAPLASSGASTRAARMFRLNLRNAENGDPVAQLELGKAYIDGVGVEVDVEKGKHWLEQAAQQGVHAATSRLEALVL